MKDSTHAALDMSSLCIFMRLERLGRMSRELSKPELVNNSEPGSVKGVYLGEARIALSRRRTKMGDTCLECKHGRRSTC